MPKWPGIHIQDNQTPLDEDDNQEEAGYGEGDGQEKSQSRVTSRPAKRGKHTGK